MKKLISAALLLLAVAFPAAAQQQPAPPFNAQPLPPLAAPPADQSAPSVQPMAPPAAPALPAASPPVPVGRDFCGQNVTAQAADPRSVPDRYRPFIGIFSDAAWNAQLCAALVVETVGADGTATITYAFGPLVSGDKTQGGVLHGTGVIKDGALLFQNNDGSQYVFQPYYSDLAGKWTTPRGQTYDAIFKRSF
jgi:hypothetical protein